MAATVWWSEMAVKANAEHDMWSADWYRSMRDQYRARFPDADQRSLDNMDQFVTAAERRESERLSAVVASSGETENE